MSGLVTVAVAGDVSEATEITSVLLRAGIESRVEGAEDELAGTPVDGPCHILVADALLDAARDALADADEAEEEDL
jgi:hypothetical protein